MSLKFLCSKSKRQISKFAKLISSVATLDINQTLTSSTHGHNIFCKTSLWNIVLLFNQRLSELSQIFRGGGLTRA